MDMTPRFLIAACFAVLAACAADRPAPPPPPKSSAASPSPPEKVASVPPAPANELKQKPSAPAKAPAKPQPKVASAAPAPAATKPLAPAPAPLDLKSLEERLKGTNAIGVLTKLSLKNQVDDLIAEFRAYHKGARPPTLSELRPAFELLLMKVLSLLQDRDPGLAHDVSASRDAIWAVLADPRKLAEFS